MSKKAVTEGWCRTIGHRRYLTARYEGTALYRRLRGGKWTSVEGDAVPGGRTQAYDIEALAPTGRTGQFWSVGTYSLIIGEFASAQYELIQRTTR